MKNVYIGLGILVVLIAGYFAVTQYMNKGAQSNEEKMEQQTGTQEPSETTPDTMQPASEATQPPAQGKINVQVVCQNALASMTFNSAADADVFVTDCVNGKHPEVIDAYIKSQGHDGAAI